MTGGKTRIAVRAAVFMIGTALGLQMSSPDVHGSQSSSNAGTQKMGPVGEQEARPSSAAPPVNSVVDPGIIPTRQAITPAGLQSVFESRVFGVAFGENGDSIYAATLGQKGTNLYQIDLKTNRMMNVLSTPVAPGMQGMIYDPATHRPLLAGLVGKAKGKDSSGQLVALGDEKPLILADGMGTNQIGSVAVARSANTQSKRLAVVALTFNDEAAVVDLDSKAVLYRVKTGIAPFGTAISADSSVAWVSNWGGRFPRTGETSAATGPEANADQALVDARGIASSGTVSGIDLLTGKLIATIAVGLHPSGLAWDEKHQRLYAADSGSRRGGRLECEA